MHPAVRAMMDGGGGGPGAGSSAAAPAPAATLQEKRKLLWGSKKQVATAQPAGAFGANRWDAAEFGSEDEKTKFLKLMVGSTEFADRRCLRILG